MAPRLVKQDGAVESGYPEVAAKLRELAERADRGEIVSIAFVAEQADHHHVQVGHVLTRDGGHFILVGGIEALKIALLSDSVAKLTDD